MKRIISAILILLMLIPSAFAAEEDPAFTVCLTGDNAKKVGDEVTITVGVKNAPACSSFRTFVTYDGDILECLSTAQIQPGLMAFNTDSPYNGQPKVGVVGASADIFCEGTVDLYSVTFRVKAVPADDAPIFAIPLCEFYDAGDHANGTPQLIESVHFEIGTVVVNENNEKVPDLKERTEADAISVLNALQLVENVVVTDYNENYPSGVVIDQAPAAGTWIAHGETVTLTVNGEPPMISVPAALKGKTREEAKKTLEDAGFHVVCVVHSFDPQYADDEVISYEPASGTFPQGTTVTLTVNSSAEPVSVPDLTGKSQSEAIAILGSDAYKLTAKSKTVPYTLGYGENAVISHTPEKGTNILQGETVTLTVNGAPKDEYIPNLVGLAKEDAAGLLQRLKFNVKITVNDYSLSWAEGTVMEQSEQAYVAKKQGTLVELKVNGAPQTKQVPSLEGCTVAEATAILQALQFKVNTELCEYNMHYEPGAVVAQSVSPDSTLLQGSTVNLIVNGVPSKTTAPYLTGNTQAQAEAELTRLKLKVYYAANAPYNMSYAVGAVVGQSPAAGTQLDQGSTVILTLNGQPEYKTIPDLKGKTKAEAEAILAELQFPVSYATGSYTAGYGADAIIDHTTGQLLQGTKVTLIVNGAKPPMENPFTDLKSEKAYYYTPVLWAVENGITTGVTKTEFRPEDPCTRGQIVTFLWRASGSPEPKTAANSFTDVKSTSYYYKAVLWAVENGITNGMGNGKFAPGEECTREQIVTFLWRSQGKPAVNSVNPFTDIKSNSYAYHAVLWAVENGITNGMGNNKFEPKGECTRGQIVTFLYRCLVK